MATESPREKRPHIAMVPFTQQGHINPMLQLARALASRGANVTFVVSDNTVPKGTEAGIPNLRIVGVADNLPSERCKGSSFKDSVDSMVNMEAGFVQLLDQSLGDEVSALIHDAYVTWAPAIASLRSIPCVCFFASNATSACLGYNVPSLIHRGILPFRTALFHCLSLFVFNITTTTTCAARSKGLPTSTKAQLYLAREAMAAESPWEKRSHIAMVPFVQQGHINLMLQLARMLASRGAKVTFVVSENTVPKGTKAGIPNLRIVGVADNLPAERCRGSSFKDSVDSMVNMEVGFVQLLQSWGVRCPPLSMIVS